MYINIVLYFVIISITTVIAFLFGVKSKRPTYEGSLVIEKDGTTHVIMDDNPNFKDVKEYDTILLEVRFLA